MIFFGLIILVGVYASWDHHRYSLVIPPSTPPSSQVTLTGRAQVLDGDTVVMNGRRVRLWGIDAPEFSQTCMRSGDVYRCGEVATSALRAKIAESVISCIQRGIDEYGRVVAMCSAGDVDIGGWLVENGFAVAYRHFSGSYYDDPEKRARANGAGIWSSSFDWPWDWRRAHPRQ
jgi:endonuclease YncB( thermonuclease family)